MVMSPPRNTGLDDLVALDGIALVVDPDGNHWVKFVVKRVEPSNARPHGLSYSLTLHGPDGERIAGFDNAHAVATGTGPARRARDAHDHKHRGQAVKAYAYQDAATLLGDFWAEVDVVLKEKGVLP